MEYDETVNLTEIKEDRVRESTRNPQFQWIDTQINGERYTMYQEGTRMMVTPLLTACPWVPEGKGHKFRL